MRQFNYYVHVTKSDGSELVGSFHSRAESYPDVCLEAWETFGDVIRLQSYSLHIERVSPPKPTAADKAMTSAEEAVGIAYDALKSAAETVEEASIAVAHNDLKAQLNESYDELNGMRQRLDGVDTYITEAKTSYGVNHPFDNS